VDGIAESGDLLSRVKSNAISDEVAAGLAYTGSLGAASVRASIVGAVPAHDLVDSNTDYAGAAVELGGVAVAGGAGINRRSNRYSAPDPGSVLSGRTLQRDWSNLGLAYGLERFAFSVSYGDARTNVGTVADADKGRFSDLVFGAEVGLLPGLVLSSELAYFSIKRTGGDGPDDVRRDNDGWVGVTCLALAF
jgi:predicted porin